jgi:hypothetical protein
MRVTRMYGPAEPLLATHVVFLRRPPQWHIGADWGAIHPIGLGLELVVLRAIMDISARAISLAEGLNGPFGSK